MWRSVSTGVRVAGLLAAALAPLACTWEPDVRPVEPRQIIGGQVYVIDHEAVAGEDYVLVVTDYVERLADRLARDTREGETPPKVQDLSPTELRNELSNLPRDILDVTAGETCRVPGRIYNYFYQRDDPEDVTVDAWRLSYVRQEVEEVEGDDGQPVREVTWQLAFMDQHCQHRGPELETWQWPTSLRDPVTQESYALVRDVRDSLWRLAPFGDAQAKRKLAEQVLEWRYLSTAPQLRDDERGVLVLQGERPDTEGEEPGPPLTGELVLIRMDGTELARIAEDVQAGFQVTNYGGLRVAWESEGVIYEAVAPDLSPVRLTPRDGDACSPGYTGGALEFLFPCDENRPNRVNLATGETERLEPGIADATSERGWDFERRYVGERDPETGARPTALWARAPGYADFVQVEPDLTSRTPIDDQLLLGIVQVEDGFGALGTWHVERGFEPLLEQVNEYYPLEDVRYTADRDEPVYLWVVHHDVRDGVGELSLLSSRDLSIESVATGVPIGGYRQYVFGAVSNPFVVILHDVKPTGGVLEARLLPELLGTPVDEGVVGFTSRSSHQEPGLYYSVGPGEREGIWFAPL